MFPRRTVALAVLSAVAGAAFAQANLVQNPGFELGAQDWDVHGGYLTKLVPQQAHGGEHAMITGCIGDRCVDKLGSGFYFRQALPTTPGEMYDLSFWTYSGRHEAQYSVYWNGQLVDLATLVLPQAEMLGHEYDGLAASSDMTMLEIHGRDDGAFIAFDDFSVQRSVSMVPEPRSWAMLVAGLALAGILLGRRWI